MASLDDLYEFIHNEVAGPFEPYVEHLPESDAINVYFKHTPDYSKRLTDHVTLFLAIDSDEIIGCRIKGISGLLEDLPNYITVNHGPVELSLIFLAARGMDDDEDRRSAFRELARSAGKLTLDPVG